MKKKHKVKIVMGVLSLITAVSAAFITGYFGSRTNDNIKTNDSINTNGDSIVVNGDIVISVQEYIDNEVINEYTNRGNEYYKAGDYENAIECYIKAVNEGDEKSLYRLSSMFYSGKGTEVNYEKAFLYASQADEKINSADAQNLLGVMYETNTFLREDKEKAEYYYEKAVVNGSNSAKVNLGRFYFWHYNDLNDDSKMYSLFLEAKNTSRIAKQYIGLCYLKGRGIEKNEKLGLQYFCDIVNGDKGKAMYLIGAKYDNGQCYDDAFEWYFKSSEIGYRSAMLNLANYYNEGKGTVKNVDEAQKWYKAYGFSIENSPGLRLFVIDNNYLPQKNIPIVILNSNNEIICELCTDESGIVIIGPLEPGKYYYKVNNEKEKIFVINETFLESDLYKRYIHKTEVIK